NRVDWIIVRVARAPVGALLASLLDSAGFAHCVTSALQGILPVSTIDRVMSPREAIQPLDLPYFVHAVEGVATILLRPRCALAPAIEVSTDDLVEERPGSGLLRLTRAQETELPGSAKITYISATNDYRQAVAEARRLAGASGRVSTADLALVLQDEQAAAIADSWLFEAWAARERASFLLPPSRLAIEPSDIILILNNGRSRLFRVTGIGDRGAREIEALSIDPELYGLGEGRTREKKSNPPAPSGQPIGHFLDLPLLRGDEPEYAGYFAATQFPWPGAVALFRSPT